jgi:hypothetical protein
MDPVRFERLSKSLTSTDTRRDLLRRPTSAPRLRWSRRSGWGRSPSGRSSNGGIGESPGPGVGP